MTPDTMTHGTNGEVFAFSFNSFIRALMVPMLAGPKRSRVVLSTDQLAVTMGSGGWMFSCAVPRSSLSNVGPSTGMVGGYGAHGWRGRWLVNGSGKGLVRMTVEPVARARVMFLPVKLRQLTVSLERPDEFISRFAAA